MEREELIKIVSKLFRAYRLYNNYHLKKGLLYLSFQSSFELTGYITVLFFSEMYLGLMFQSSFELTGYITIFNECDRMR